MSKSSDRIDRTPYVTEMVRRFYDHAHPKDGTSCSYEDYASYLYILNCPRAYNVESEMLEYAMQHEKATLRELADHCNIVIAGKEPVEDPDEKEKTQ